MSYGKGPRGTATRYHSLIIRARGRCEKCGSSGPLECAHIIRRRYANTRTEIRNGLCLCRSCHYWFDHNEYEAAAWLTDHIGADVLAELYALRDCGKKWSSKDWVEESARLRGIWKELARA